MCAFARLFARACTPGIMNMYGSLCGRYARVLFPAACVRKIKGCRPPSFSPLPPPLVFAPRSSAAANRPPPSLRSPSPPPRLPLSIPEIASRSHSRRIFFFSCSAPLVSSPPPSPPSTSFARVYITRACAPSLSFLFSLFPAPSSSFAFPSRFARNARFSSQGIYQLEDNHRGDEDCVIKRMEEGLSLTICIFLSSFS